MDDGKPGAHSPRRWAPVTGVKSEAAKTKVHVRVPAGRAA
jgi:hypothetical protein